MTCATCGRENPPHLTFCQECGQRLGPRIAPPTPPIGLGGDYGRPAPISARAAGADPHGPPVQVPSILATSLGAGPAGERRCRVCATPNGPTLRYCTSCGSTLDVVQAVGAAAVATVGVPRMVEPAPAAPAPAQAAPVAPAPAPFAATALADKAATPRPASRPPSRPPPRPASAAPIARIAPMRVVEVGNGARANPEGPRVCHRCRGLVDSAAQFCKFCGASLADAGAQPGPGQTAGQAQGQVPPPTVPMLAAPAQAAPPAPAPPAPAAMQVARGVVRGRLVVIAKSGADGPSYPIGDTLDIGRTEGQIIVGEDPYLSPRHVRIVWTGAKLVLRDLSSTNGVYIRLVAARDMAAGTPEKQPPKAAANDDDIPGEVAVPLHDQDLILVGQQVLRFESTTAGSQGDAGFGPATEHGTLLFGSPAAPRYARLSQRTVEGVTRDVYYVRKVETVLGRESGDVVFTEDPFLSRRHAAIRVLGTDATRARAPLAPGAKPPALAVQFALVDLGSSNGTFLRIRGEIDLVAGDHFRVGQQLFRVDLGTDAQPDTRAQRGAAG